MRKIRCPKCDEFITFDEERIEEGHSLMFRCPSCGKNFSVRFKSKKEKEKTYTFGSIVVVENVFCNKQILPLQLGENTIGRRCKGTDINTPIDTSDMSMDRIHCTIIVKEGKNGELTYYVKDEESLVGTFVMNDILQKNEKRVINDGEIITLGATTLILNTNKEDSR